MDSSITELVQISDHDCIIKITEILNYKNKQMPGIEEV
jgi:hypothetical protein